MHQAVQRSAMLKQEGAAKTVATVQSALQSADVLAASASEVADLQQRRLDAAITPQEEQRALHADIVMSLPPGVMGSNIPWSSGLFDSFHSSGILYKMLHQLHQPAHALQQ